MVAGSAFSLMLSLIALSVAVTELYPAAIVACPVVSLSVSAKIQQKRLRSVIALTWKIE
jgi:hypothetical protein